MKAFENISWGIFIVCVIYYGLVEYEIIFPPQELTDGMMLIGIPIIVFWFIKWRLQREKKLKERWKKFMD
tara:strand:- start:650 stop:859 length:210 start_codon:yes stop_codon:yes gene_type:complete